jgi:CheY-like chemotaxis protein
MVELMGGEIHVSSKEGEGTIFTFSCPFSLAGDVSEAFVPGPARPSEAAVLPETDSPAADAENDENAALRGMRVLLVEDNEINALIATELLNAVGVETTTAQNGSEALEQLELAAGAHHGVPAFDLVLMDLQMPVMDGYEATKIIKSTPKYKDIPVYALTAHAFPEERERCFALGMEEHLTKPINVESFYEALRKLRTAVKK